MAKQYTIGEYSQKFLDALDALQVAKSKFFEALTATYGEERADEYFQEHIAQYEGAEQAVMEYLRILFTASMGTEKPALTL